MRLMIEDELCTFNNDWPKENPYLRTRDKLFANSFYGKSAFEWKDYCEHDTKITKEIVTSMNKIKTVGLDPRKHCNASNIYAVINGKAYAPEIIRMIRIDQAVPGYEFTIEPNPMYAVVNTMFSIKDVIFNPPATIVFWGDGSKTVVKCQNGEEFDPEKGLTMAFFKRMHDNKGHYFEEIKKWTKEYFDKEAEEARSFLEELVNHMLTSNNPCDKEKEDGTKKSTRWALFYAPVDRNEDETYTKYTVTYAHKSSAVRAAKRLLAKLPKNIEYTWFVDSIETY